MMLQLHVESEFSKLYQSTSTLILNYYDRVNNINSNQLNSTHAIMARVFTKG